MKGKAVYMPKNKTGLSQHWTGCPEILEGNSNFKKISSLNTNLEATLLGEMSMYCVFQKVVHKPREIGGEVYRTTERGTVQAGGPGVSDNDTFQQAG